MSTVLECSESDYDKPQSSMYSIYEQVRILVTISEHMFPALSFRLYLIVQCIIFMQFDMMIFVD